MIYNLEFGEGYALQHSLMRVKKTCSTTVVLRKTLCSTNLCPRQHSSWKTFIIYMTGLEKKTYVLQAYFWEERYSINKTVFEKNRISYYIGFEKKLLYSKTLVLRNNLCSSIFMLYKTLILYKHDCEEKLAWIKTLFTTTPVLTKILFCTVWLLK